MFFIHRRATVCIFLTALTLILGGCRSAQTIDHYTERIRTDTLMQRDSIYVRDSIIITQRGDTIFMDRWHDRWRDRIIYRSRTDTIRDTIRTTITKTKKAEAPTPWGLWVVIISLVIILFLTICKK